LWGQEDTSSKRIVYAILLEDEWDEGGHAKEMIQNEGA